MNVYTNMAFLMVFPGIILNDCNCLGVFILSGAERITHRPPAVGVRIQRHGKNSRNVTRSNRRAEVMWYSTDFSDNSS